MQSQRTEGTAPAAAAVRGDAGAQHFLRGHGLRIGRMRRPPERQGIERVHFFPLSELPRAAPSPAADPPQAARPRHPDGAHGAPHLASASAAFFGSARISACEGNVMQGRLSQPHGTKRGRGEASAASLLSSHAVPGIPRQSSAPVQTAGQLQNGALAHAVNQNIGLGIQQKRPTQAVRPEDRNG